MTTTAPTTIIKTTIECYKLRHLPHGTWADISVDANGNAGRIQISSDYGDWQYYWAACGMPFKEFLISLQDLQYVASKFKEADQFDGPATVGMYRRMIIESRRLDELDEKKARLLWDETVELESRASDLPSFDTAIIDVCPRLYEWMDYCPEYRTTISFMFRRFWEEAWPVFIAALQHEVNTSLP